jgi:hypothetical protein
MTKFNLTKIEMDELLSTMADADSVDEDFNLQRPVEQPELWDDLDQCETNEDIDLDSDEFEDYEDDGQPSEYDEWQDYYGGDDSIYENDCDCMFDN